MNPAELRLPQRETSRAPPTVQTHLTMNSADHALPEIGLSLPDLHMCTWITHSADTHMIGMRALGCTLLPEGITPEQGPLT